MNALFKYTNSMKKQRLVKQGLAKYGLATALTLSISLGLDSGVAQAATITFAYEGVIDQASGGAAFDAFLGETLRVEYTFDDTAMGNVDTDASSFRGIYTISAFTATLGGNSYNGNGRHIDVLDDADNGAGVFDRYLVILSGLGPSIGGLAFNTAQVRFRDSTQSAFADDSLPLIQPDPSAFDEVSLGLFFDDVGLSASIVTISAVSAVPVPAAVWLFGSGLLGLVGVARRKSANP